MELGFLKRQLVPKMVKADINKKQKSDQWLCDSWSGCAESSFVKGPTKRSFQTDGFHGDTS